jgi:hypothetical protein
MPLNEAASELARAHGCTLHRNFSVAGRALTELRFPAENRSELWDLGAYSADLFQPKLTPETPTLIAHIEGELPRGRDGHWEARKLIEARSRTARSAVPDRLSP